ncbi:DUF2997 domain-containing protein [Myxococcota bacterium]|jgi:hypothetical protein|nr:DUF2997 domain-containing protein [Myxococcota bacterium]
MAVKRELQIEITADGEVKITVKGAPGGECLELTKALEESLGVVTDRQMTSEFYQQEVTTEDTVKIGED